MIKVAILSHQSLLKQVIKTILQGQSNITIVGEMGIDREAIQTLKTLQPDVTIVTSDTTYTDWFHQTQKLMRVVPMTRLLVLAAQNDNVFPTRLMKAGAAGYLTQHHSPEELIYAINYVAQGKQYLSPDVAAQVMSDHLNTNPLHQPFNKLPDCELEIAYRLASGYSTEEIAAELYLAAGTINCYRHRVLKRLNLANTTALTYLAAQHHLIDLPYMPPENDNKAPL